MTSAMPKSTFEMVAAPCETPLNPSQPVTSEMTRKMMAHLITAQPPAPEGACARTTEGLSIGGRRISCSRLWRSPRW